MNDSELDKILHSVGDEPPLGPGFRSQVWRRIESSSAESPGLAGWFEKVLSPLGKPAMAATTILAMTAIGFGLGAGFKPRQENWQEAYVQSVSPFALPNGQ